MAELIAPVAARRGDAPALVDETGSTTWRAFDERVNRLVHALREIGLPPGGTIATLSGNRREWFEALFAAAHGGWVLVPINWHFVTDEVAYVLENSEAQVLLADARFLDTARESADRVPGVHTRVLAGHRAGDEPDGWLAYEELLASGSPAEPADQVLGGPMFYTSGTTGRPKGVRSSLLGSGTTPPSLMALVAAGLTGSVGVPDDGVTLLCGPAYHSAQWAFTFFPLVNGSTVVMRHKFDPEEVLRLIDEHRVTNVHLVPTQFTRLLNVDPVRRASFDGSSLVVACHGAAPCPPEIKRRMIEWWGPKITEYYGGTEGGFISVITASEWLEHPGSVGRPLPMVEVMVVRDDETLAPPGEPGQLYFKSLMGLDFEYHKDPDKTQAAHRAPGVFTLGDIGYLDDDGYLYLSDRKIDMIISGGVNIYPAEIEGVLAGHAAVADAAVFGIPDDEFGEAVHAVVQLHDGIAGTEALRSELLARCREHLAGYKVPRTLEFADALPRTESGKLLKRQLRDPFWAATGRTI